MTSAPAERSALVEEGSHYAMPIAAGNDTGAAESAKRVSTIHTIHIVPVLAATEASAEAASPSPDPWLRDTLAALQLARLYEPLPPRLQEPLCALQHALRQSPKSRR